MHTRSEVKEFYDDFSREVLLKDFVRLNLRQLAIKEFCSRFILPGARVLELGCGVGIISKHLQKIASSILSIDISEENIEIARLYATSPKSQFRVLDILSEEYPVDELGEFDAILLADVIEHIPKEKHVYLFSLLEKLLVPDGIVLITYPSPEYQEYLKRKKPHALQIIDETIRIEDLLINVSLSLVFFSTLDIWFTNQYVHAVLARQTRFSPRTLRRNLFDKIVYRFRTLVWQLNNRGFLKRVKDVD